MAAVLSLHCFQKPYSSIASPPLNPTPLLNNCPSRLRIKRSRCSNSSISFSEKDEIRLGFFSSNSIVKRYDQGLNCSTSGSASESEPEPEPKPKGELDDNVGVKAALSMLRFYKREISPLLPNSCRYVPTCSEYSMIAYKKYGVVKGTVLTAWRLCRCNPLGGSGFDPPRWFGEENTLEQ